MSGSVTRLATRARRDGEGPRLAASARSDDVAPWRRAGPKDQSRLLDWFLSADLSTDAAYQVLCVLTGRWRPDEWETEADIQAALRRSLKYLGWSETGWQDLLSRPARRRRVVPTGTETGHFGSQRFTSRSGLIKHFRKVQETLKRIQERFVTAKKTDSHADRLRSSRSLNVLVDVLGDVRFDFAREDETEWPRVFGRRPLRRMPLEWESASTSLAGELALALSQRMLGAKKVGRCPVCGSAWISTDGRSRRILCYNPDCARVQRQRRKKPEPREKVNARVARWREKRATARQLAQRAADKAAETPPSPRSSVDSEKC